MKKCKILILLCFLLIGHLTDCQYYVKTLVGNGVASSTGDNSPPSSATVNNPGAVWVDSNGNIYIGEITGYKVRMINPSGTTITTIIGTGTETTTGGSGPGTSTGIDRGYGVYGDTRYVYVSGYYFLWKYDTVTGIVSRYAGATPAGSSFSGDSGQATSANINVPRGIFLSSMGILYFADRGNNRVRAISTSGIITTFAGTGSSGFTGDSGAATSAKLNSPRGVWGNTVGVMYIADNDNNRVRRVSGGIITTFAGTGTSTYNSDNIQATSANLNSPSDVKGDTLGNIYVAEYGGCRIRKISTSGIITTIVGTGTCTSASTAVQLASTASVNGIFGIWVETASVGNLPNLYYAEYDGNFVRYVYDTSPTAVPTAIPTNPPTAVPTALPTTSAPTVTPSATPSFNPSALPTKTPTLIPTYVPTFTPSMAPTTTPTCYPTAMPSVHPTAVPTTIPTAMPTKVPTRVPTTIPTIPFPSSKPSFRPTMIPSSQPSNFPSGKPSCCPTLIPSSQPSSKPTIVPSSQPSSLPSSQPSSGPSRSPRSQPSSRPTSIPSSQPSGFPSGKPSCRPTVIPSSEPSSRPTVIPSSQPSSLPSSHPSSGPSRRPSNQPSSRPTVLPTCPPSSLPSSQPSRRPSIVPSNQPSSRPTVIPSSQPSNFPSGKPSCCPTVLPSSQPSSKPTIVPSSQPSSLPSSQPSSRPTIVPSNQPSSRPTIVPSCQPSSFPSSHPSGGPSSRPSSQPSSRPTTIPSSQPSTLPSSQPICLPTASPSHQPSSKPTIIPSAHPSGLPTSNPTCLPTIAPSNQPSSRPTMIPSCQPSSFPSFQPNGKPSRRPSAMFTILPSSPHKPVFFSPPTIPPSSVSFSFPTNTTSWKTFIFLYGISSSSQQSAASFSLLSPTTGSSLIVFGNQRLSSLQVINASSSRTFSLYPMIDVVPAVARDLVSRACVVPGDLNLDGFNDIIVCYPASSICYLYFGNAMGLSKVMVSSTIHGSQSSFFGFAVDSAGDVNQDGYLDVIISAVTGRSCFVIYGRESWLVDLYTSQMKSGGSVGEGADGFQIVADTSTTLTGMSVAGVGDMNGDGKPDLAVSVQRSQKYVIYILFGEGQAGKDISLAEVGNGVKGYQITGEKGYYTGLSISRVGDVNGDGLADVVIGAIPMTINDGEQKSYVVFGMNTTQIDDVSLGSLENGGVVIIGGGFIVSGPGDLNNDGMNEIIVTSVAEYLGKGNTYIILYPESLESPPSLIPTSQPSSSPSTDPTSMPSTSTPSSSPSSFPLNGSLSLTPTFSRTRKPSPFPTVRPSIQRTSSPSTQMPTIHPTRPPSPRPTRRPTFSPSTVAPSMTTAPSYRMTSPPLSQYHVTSINMSSLDDEGVVYGTDGLDEIFDISSNSLNGSLQSGWIIGGRGRKIYRIHPKDATQAENSIILKDFDISKDIIDLSLYSTLSGIESLTYQTIPLRIILPDNQLVVISTENSMTLDYENFIFASSSDSSSSSFSITTAALLKYLDTSMVLVICLVVPMVAISVLFYLSRRKERERSKNTTNALFPLVSPQSASLNDNLSRSLAAYLEPITSENWDEDNDDDNSEEVGIDFNPYDSSESHITVDQGEEEENSLPPLNNSTLENEQTQEDSFDENISYDFNSFKSSTSETVDDDDGLEYRRPERMF